MVKENAPYHWVAEHFDKTKRTRPTTLLKIHVPLKTLFFTHATNIPVRGHAGHRNETYRYVGLHTLTAHARQYGITNSIRNNNNNIVLIESIKEHL